jgi:hypothetical protein
MIATRNSALSSALAAVAVLALCPRASSQIIEERTYNGRQITCGLSGLFGFGRSCGTQNDEDVFVGTILSVKQVSEYEMDVTLRPEEVFKGAPSAPLNITTSQGICLPEIHTGDRWLFYLWREKESGNLLLTYGSGSGPVADEQEAIDRLRRLSKLQGAGLIKGLISTSDENGDWSPRANHRVVVRRLEDNAEYTVFSDTEGRFEFPPLRAGEYDLDLNTEPGLWTEWTGKMKVEAQQCMDYSAQLQIDGTISGHVRTAEGKPPNPAQVGASSDRESSSAFTDESGYFEIHGLAPGRYQVSILEGQHGEAGVYAPGVRDKSKAVVVDLGRAEKREGVDIRIPPASSK